MTRLVFSLSSMSNLLAIDFKSTKPVDFAGALRKHALNNFSEPEAHPDNLRPDIDGIHQLRKQAILSHNGKPEIHPSILRDMLVFVLLVSALGLLLNPCTCTCSYYAQLTFLTSKFPADVGLAFPWFPIFDSQGIAALSAALPGMLPSQTAISLSSIQFERANVLFNIAAMQVGLALAEKRSNAEGIKRACVLFQNAAGCFLHLQATVLPLLRLSIDDKDPCSPDLSKSCLESLSALCLAQAQESAWQKAVMDRLKNGTIAKLAAQVSEYYDSAFNLAKQSQGGGNGVWPVFGFPGHFLSHLQIKKAHFAAASQYRKSQDDLAANRYGDEIGRLQHAESLLKTAQALPKRGVHQSLFDEMRGLQATIADTLKRAVKDNDLIYLQLVPTPDKLPPIGPASLVKAGIPPEVHAPIQCLHGGPNGLGKPFFETLVPYGVHLAISIYDNRKEEFVKNEIQGRADELEAISRSTLQGLNLPASIQALETPIGLPPSLLQKAEDVRLESGPAKIRSLLQDVARLAQNDRNLMNEASSLLNAEEEEDAEARQQMSPQRWNRPQSKDLNQQLRFRVQKFGETLDTASASDNVVRQKYMEWEDKIELLGGPQDSLERSVPTFAAPRMWRSTEPDSNPAQTNAVRQLRGLIERLDDLSLDRQQTTERAKRTAQSDEVRPTIMREAGEIAQDTPLGQARIDAAQFEPLFERELQKYNVYAQELDSSERKQEQLLQQIQQANEAFLQARQEDQTSKRREEALQALDMAFSKYREISVNLAEGLKFYGDFANLLVQLRDDCREWTRLRRVEARDLSNSLSQSLAGVSLSGVPSPPPSRGAPPPSKPVQWNPSMPIKFG